MNKLSQNKKIAISAVVLFLISFVTMLFFLEYNDAGDGGYVNIMEVSGHGDENVEETDMSENPYAEYVGDDDNPLIATNAEGKVVYVSKKVCNMLVIKCDDFGGTSFFDYVNTKDLPEFVESHTKLIQTPENMDGLGPFRMIKGKEEIIVMINAYPLLDEEGKVSEIIFTLKDITAMVEEMNNEKDTPVQEGSKWIEHLYPRIESMKNANKVVADL